MATSDLPEASAPTASPRVAVFAASDEFIERASETSVRLKIPLLLPDQAAGATGFDLLLWVDRRGLGLRPTGPKAPNPVSVDFVGGSLGFRGKRSAHTRELVAKAVGVKGGNQPYVLDATAGLGRDAFILACLGCRVDMLERSPVICMLLQDGLERGRQDPQVAEVMQRMRLIEADALNFMIEQGSHLHPEVVYLDPMFPERSKSASVKKDMQILQNLLGADLDAGRLFEQALKVATRKVVVKRPRVAPWVSDMEPHHVVEGKTSRFDIYHVKALS